MKLLKLSLMIFCLVICIASPSFSLDPYKTNIAGFGPRVAGTRLGVKMSLRDIVRWRTNFRDAPFTLEVNSERIPGSKSSEVGSISILMSVKDRKLTGFEITSASRKFYPLKSERMKLADLLAEIEKIGVENVSLMSSNGRIREDCISFTDDFRVASLRIRRSDFDSGNMTHEDFVREFTEAYHLPEMKQRGNTWDFKNEREGWQMTYITLGGGIFELSPIITE